MTDTLKLKNGLVMPSNFIEVKDDEMEYVDGGVMPAWVAALGFLFGMSPLAALILVGVGVVLIGVGIVGGYYLTH